VNPRTVLTLADGRNIDLLNPNAADFRDLDWAAEHLAKENRYNGATPGICYSVAQHSAECALAAFEATGDERLCAYLTVHDLPEALLKDDTTPKKRAFAAIAEEKFGVLASQVLSAFDDLTDRHDKAIHEAVGLAWPPTPEMARAIKHFDRVLLVTEWCDLMAPYPLPNAEAYADVSPLTRRIRAVENWQTAAELLRTYWRRFLPAFQTENA
jgi:5'-deoxynucleotidase YfbR-like HD superfamily hydrolase